MKALQRPLLLAGLVFLAAYLLPLGLRPLFTPDEVRYAEIAREMLRHGDWVVPHLDGLNYFEKPIFGYWSHAASLWLFGENNFAVRFPSALASGLTALLLLFFCRLPSRAAAGRQVGGLAVLIYLTILTVVGIGTYAVLDSQLTLFLTLTLIAFFRATEELPKSGAERFWLVVAGIGCGLAFLTKGFLALAVPVLVAAPYLAWQRRFRDLLRLPWLPFLVAVLVALPWSLLIQLRAPDFWNFFFWHEHVQRFLSKHAQHARSFWFFFALLLPMTLPWSFLLGSVWQGAREPATPSPREHAVLRFALCWLIFPFLFFSVSKGKLLTYILPCFPAIAVLLACWLDRYAATGKRRSFRAGALLAAGFFALLLVALQFAQLIGHKGAPAFASPWPWLGGSLVLGVTSVLYLSTLQLQQTWPRLLLFAIAPLPLLCAAPLLMPDLTLARKAPVAFIEQVGRQIPADDLVISDGSVMRAVNWGLKRDDVDVLQNTGELAYGLEQPGSRERFLDLAAARQKILAHPGKTVVFLKDGNYRNWHKELPPPVRRQDNQPGSLVVLWY